LYCISFVAYARINDQVQAEKKPPVGSADISSYNITLQLSCWRPARKIRAVSFSTGG
jgi:hypothetical protein